MTSSKSPLTHILRNVRTATRRCDSTAQKSRLPRRASASNTASFSCMGLGLGAEASPGPETAACCSPPLRFGDGVCAAAAAGEVASTLRSGEWSFSCSHDAAAGYLVGGKREESSCTASLRSSTILIRLPHRSSPSLPRTAATVGLLSDGSLSLFLMSSPLVWGRE